MANKGNIAYPKSKAQNLKTLLDKPKTTQKKARNARKHI